MHKDGLFLKKIRYFVFFSFLVGFGLLYGKTEIHYTPLGPDSLLVQIQFIPETIQISKPSQSFSILSPGFFYVTVHTENVKILSISPGFQDHFEFPPVYDVSNDGQIALNPRDTVFEALELKYLGKHGSKKLFLIRVLPRFQDQWLRNISFICTGPDIRVVSSDSIYSFEIDETTLGKTTSFVYSLSEVRWRVPALKIWIQKEGWYIIPYSMFVKAGWNVSGIDPKKLRLLNSRGEIPIRVVGEEDGSFDFTDAVEFYGEPLYDLNRPGEKRLDVFSSANVYWLEVGEDLGIRLGQEYGKIDESKKKEFPKFFMYSEHEEKDYWRVNLSYSDVFDIDNAEYFMYGGIDGGQSITWEFYLDSPELYATELAKLRIKVRGQTQLRDRQPFDVLINNRLVLSEFWFENTAFLFESKEFSPTFLREGKNTITVINRSLHEEQVKLFIDWFEIIYPHKFETKQNYLRFSPPKGQAGKTCTFRIEGFSTPNVEVYKLGASMMTGLKTEIVLDSLGNRSYAVLFQDEIVDENTEYVAVSSDAKLLPDSVTFVRGIFLRKNRGADYIVITPSDSLGKKVFQDWTRLRESQGFSVAFVLLDSIYNEFNGGIPHPRAIRDFLAYAKKYWTPPPRFVLLVGDGEIDNRKANGKGHVVPVYFHHAMKFGSTASDFWYTLLDEDEFADLAIGRLPVHNQEELKEVLNKIVEYETSSPGAWKNRYLLIGGGRKNDIFALQSRTVVQEFLPPSLHSDLLFPYGDPNDPEIGGKERLLAYFREGVGWMNFRGHGGGAIWADAGLLDFEDVKSIENKGKLPIITSLTCYTAAFAGNCLGEALICQKENGAVAFFGATGLGWLSNDFFLLQHILKIYNSNPDLSLGEIIQLAKKNYYIENPNTYGLSEIHQYILLGDPAIRFPFPKETNILHAEQRSLSVSDSLHLSIANQNGFSKFQFELTDSLYHTKEIYEVPDNVSEINLPMPSLGIGKKIGLRTYAWDERQNIHGRQFFWFSVEKPHLDSITVIPNQPTSRDSIKIQVFVQDQNLIRKVSLQILQPYSQMIELKPVTQKWYETVHGIGPFSPGTEVVYILVAESMSGRISQSDSLSIKIPTLPDLAVYDIRLGGKETVLLESVVYNHGEENVASVRVKFECQELGFFAEDTLDVLGLSSATASVPFSPPSGKFLFHVEVNPEFIYEESSTKNNTYQKTILMNKFNVTPESGSFSGNSSPSEIRVETVGHVQWVSLQIPSGVVSEKTVLEISQEFFTDESKPDTSVYLEVRYLVNLSNNPFATLNEEISLVFAFRSQEMLFQVKPYQWHSSLKSWLVPSFLIQDSCMVIRTRSLGKFTFRKTEDIDPPLIEIEVNQQPFVQGSYVPKEPIFSILIEDQSGVDIRSGHVIVYLDQIPQSSSLLTISDSPETLSHVNILFRPSLSSGFHSISVEASDVHGNLAKTDAVRFQVAEAFEIHYLGNHPNPFRRKTIFVYELTDRADRVSIKIYTVSGKCIRTIEEASMAEADYHEVEWDGTDEHGDEVANGVYFFRLQVKKGDVQKGLTEKIAKVR